MKRAKIHMKLEVNFLEGVLEKNYYKHKLKNKIVEKISLKMSGEYSKDKSLRHSLKVSWNSNVEALKAVVIGINPSKANDEKSDNTITKLSKFLDMYGYSEFLMLSLFQNYATDQDDIDFCSKTDFNKYLKDFEKVDSIIIVW